MQILRTNNYHVEYPLMDDEFPGLKISVLKDGFLERDEILEALQKGYKVIDSGNKYK